MPEGKPSLGHARGQARETCPCPHGIGTPDMTSGLACIILFMQWFRFHTKEGQFNSSSSSFTGFILGPGFPEICILDLLDSYE